MHGRDGEIRCMTCGKVFESDVDLTPQSVCPNCQTVGELRPNIVWFGEMPMHMDEIYAALAEADLFVAIGTSGSVYPAAGFVEEARAAGVRTCEINLQPSDNARRFDSARYGPASEAVPQWADAVLAGEGM
jgi:NAD-dependent deacetylase